MQHGRPKVSKPAVLVKIAHNSCTPPCRTANYSLPARWCVCIRLLLTLHSLLQQLNKYQWLDIGRSDLDEKDWCGACRWSPGVFCHTSWNCKYTECLPAAEWSNNTPPGKEGKNDGRNTIPRLICLCHHPSPQIFLFSSCSSPHPFVSWFDPLSYLCLFIW